MRQERRALHEKHREGRRPANVSHLVARVVAPTLVRKPAKHRRNEAASDSSGGGNRVAIARPLLMHPDWLLLDVSTAAMDENMEAQIYRIIAGRLPKPTTVSIG